MKPGTRYAIAAAALLAALVIAVGLCFLLIGRAVQASDQRWCTILNLVTSQPAQQSSRPLTREQADLQRRYLAAMLSLKRQFGC